MTDTLSRLTAALADRYTIERELGTGGMATVYLAEDLKHKRKVALKVLRPELAAVLGAERFVQEITTTANLQHPHILPLFDSGRTGGTADGRSDPFLYYVMPYVEGETLRQKLDREKQLGIEEAVKITTEVADALGYAHEQGVIHRDIKPENILLHNGRPMVADFGIALAVSAAAGGRMTETGLSLGTPHYMSPEQATAERDITNRSDVYSLGAVLYEMLTGDPPHIGGNAQQIISKIVTEEPAPVTKARKSVPPNVAAAVAKSLEKLPADRFGSANALADALHDASFSFAPRDRPDGRLPAVRPIAVLGWSMATVFATLWLLNASRPTEISDVVRFSVPVDGGYAMPGGITPELTLSPDGRVLAYYASGQIYLRHLDQAVAVPLDGAAGGRAPFFSPDGQHVAFVRRLGFGRVPLSGGPIAEVTGVVAGFGAAWAPDGYFVFGPGLMRVPDVGGHPESITDLADGEFMHLWPHVTPDGEFVVFTAAGPAAMWNDSKVVMQDLTTGERVLELPNVTDGRYVDGFLLYVTGYGTIFALPFDLARGKVTGEPVAVESGVMVGLFGGAASFAVSPSGTAAFVRGSNFANHLLVTVDRRGNETEIGPATTLNFPTLEPNGRRIALSRVGPEATDLVFRHMDTGLDEVITFDVATHESPMWSPDGRHIAFAVASTEGMDIYVQVVGTPEQPRLLTTRPHHTHVTAWSPDGEWLALFEVFPEAGAEHLFAVRVDAADTVVSLTREPEALTRNAVFSPDGGKVAYEEGGDVVVAPFPPTGGRQRVSRNGGREPRWVASGELFFWHRDTLMVTTEASDERRGFETPRAVFAMPHADLSYRGYDVSNDGQRFVVTVRNPDARASEIEVVVNWLETVKEKVGN